MQGRSESIYKCDKGGPFAYQEEAQMDEVKMQKQKEAKEIFQQESSIQEEQNIRKSIMESPEKSVEAEALFRRKMAAFMERRIEKEHSIDYLKKELKKMEEEISVRGENPYGESDTVVTREMQNLLKRYLLVQDEIKKQERQTQEWEAAREELLQKYSGILVSNEEIDTEKAYTDARFAVERRIREIEQQVKLEYSQKAWNTERKELAIKKQAYADQLFANMDAMQEMAERYAARRGSFDSEQFIQVGVCLNEYLKTIQEDSSADVIAKSAQKLLTAVRAYQNTHAKPRKSKEGQRRIDMMIDLSILLQKGTALRENYQKEMEQGEWLLQTHQKAAENAYTRMEFYAETRIRKEKEEEEDRVYVKQEREREKSEKTETAKKQEEIQEESQETEAPKEQEMAQEEKVKSDEEAAELAANVLDWIKSGKFDLASEEDILLFAKEGVLYDKEHKCGLLYGWLQVHNKFQFASYRAEGKLEKLMLTKDGKLHLSAEGGIEFSAALIKNEMEVTNDYIGLLAKLNVELLSAVLAAECKAGQLGSGEYGIKAKADAKAVLAEVSGKIAFDFMGIKFGVEGSAGAGVGASGEAAVTNKRLKLKADVLALVGAGLGVDMDYSGEIAPELVLWYLGEQRKQLRGMEQDMERMRESGEIEIESMLKEATDTDKAWWEAETTLDYESGCCLELLHRALAQKKPYIDTLIVTLQERLQEKFDRYEAYLVRNSENLSRDDEVYLREQLYILMEQKAVFESDNILQELINGEAVKKLVEIQRSGYCPQDLYVEMYTVMKPIREKMKGLETKDISVYSKESMEWYNNLKSLKNEKDVEKTLKGLARNARMLPGYEEYADDRYWNTMIPETIEEETTAETLIKRWKGERPEDLQKYIKSIIDKYAENLNKEQNDVRMLKEYPLQLLLKLDYLRHAYRHTDDEMKAEVLRRKDLADQILITCGKLETYMQYVEGNERK